MGWLAVFFWPFPLFVGLFLVRMVLDNAPAEVLLVFVVLSAMAIMVYLAGKSLARRAKGQYDCPVCGHNIMNTPHNCPNCGTRLIWGYLPGPGDLQHPHLASESWY